MSTDPIEVLREQRAHLAILGETVIVAALDAALASLSAPKGDLTVEELVEMLGGIVYWSGLDEASIGMHGDAKVTGELEAAVTLLNARLSAPKPESAEAVLAATVVTMMGRDGEVGAPCVLLEPSYEAWLDQQPPSTSHRLYTAPPRPEASAPVGVEDETLALIVERAFKAGASAALAQQPAANTHNRRLKAQLEQEWANLQDLKRAYQTQQTAAVDGARDLIGALQVAELALRERGLRASGEYRQIEATLAKYVGQQQGGTPE